MYCCVLVDLPVQSSVFLCTGLEISLYLPLPNSVPNSWHQEPVVPYPRYSAATTVIGTTKPRKRGILV